MRHDWDDREDRDPNDAKHIRKEFLFLAALVGLGMVVILATLWQWLRAL